MNRRELYQAQAQALKPPQMYGLTGLLVGVPSFSSVDEMVEKIAEVARQNLLDSGIDPSQGDVNLIRVDLPCGCHVVYASEADIPRADQRCWCGRNWFVRYVPVGGDSCPSCAAS